MSDTVNLTIDGQAVSVPKGTNVLEAAKLLGIDISAFCYHPGLPIVAQCRQCLVSVEKNPKLQPSCQQVVGEGMVVHTTDAASTLARKQQLEFTLVNHPIDCPICDKAGECTLQKLYFDHDNANSRVDTTGASGQTRLRCGIGNSHCVTSCCCCSCTSLMASASSSVRPRWSVPWP